MCCVRDTLQAAAQELQQFLTSSQHRGEAKVWLQHTLSQLQNVSSSARRACFHPLCDADYSSSSSRDSSSSSCSPVASCKDAELQLLQALAEARPEAVSALLLRDPDWVCAFLTCEERDTTKAWFQHFGPTSISHFKFGARALANYALAERATVWAHLVWTGKHAQSPVAVAAKPHYFAELDVVATVHNLARSCPGFWRSDELMRSCQAGEWLGLDRDAVAKELRRLLHEPRSSRHQPLHLLLSDLLATADWVLLCHRLLPLLPDRGLLQITSILAADMQAQQRQQEGRHHHHRRQSGARQQQQQQPRHSSRRSSSSLLASWCSMAAQGESSQAVPVPAADLPCVSQVHMLLLGCFAAAAGSAAAWSLDQLLLANALSCHRSQLLAMLWQDEDAAPQLLSVVAAAAALCADTSAAAPTAEAAAGAAAVGGEAMAAGVGLAELPSAIGQLPPGQQLILLLVAGWLLRLALLLQLSAAANSADDTAHTQQQAVALPTGATCYFVQQPAAMPAQPAAAAAGTQPAQQQLTNEPAQPPPQQQAVNNPEQAQQQQQQQQQPKQPLRRGRPSSPRPKAAQRSSSSDGSEGAQRGGHRRLHSKHKRSKRRRHSKFKHSSKALKHSRHTRPTSSSDTGTDASDSSSSSLARRRHKRQRRHTIGAAVNSHSSSSSSSSDDDGEEAEWAAMDLDAGGQLLDSAAEFHGSSSRKLAPARTASSSTAARRHSAPARVARVAEQTDTQQQRQRGGGARPSAEQPSLAVVVEQLSSLAVGGRLWAWPRCAVSVAPTQQLQGGGGVTGTVLEAADAVAQLWLQQALRQHWVGR